MKRELCINIVLGIISLLIIGYIIVHSTSSRTTQTPTIQNNKPTISMNDFTRHNSVNDCWIRINGNVYNITNFLNEHPGGPDIILPYCGGPDATGAFATKGGRGAHSPRADQLLQGLLIGILSS
jgi:cytochrome b involved in lipid metabolism